MKIELLATDISWIWIFLEETKLRLVLKALSSTEQKFGTHYQLISKLEKTLMLLRFNKKVDLRFMQFHCLHSSVVHF